LLGLGWLAEFALLLNRIDDRAHGLDLAALAVEHGVERDGRREHDAHARDQEQDPEQTALAVVETLQAFTQGHWLVPSPSPVPAPFSGVFFFAPASSGQRTSYSSTYFCFVPFTTWLTLAIF